MKGVAAAAFALVLTGCSDSLTCSLVGCASHASVRLHDPSPALQYPLTAHACFDDRCADLVIPGDPRPLQEEKVLPCPGQGPHSCADFRSMGGYVAVVFPDPPTGTGGHTASALVTDATGAVVLRSSQQVTLTKFAPNGERCGPVCWSGAANFSLG